MESIMAHAPSSSSSSSSPSPSSSVEDSALPPPATPVVAAPSSPAPPDARASRDRSGHFTHAFRLAAVRYAAACGKSQRAAALDIGISDKTLSEWARDAQPDPVTGAVDAARFDELAQLRAQNRELLAQAARLTAERDFLKKCASYFASPATGGSR
jgi:transposase-like protein